jgi:hypothetical protein
MENLAINIFCIKKRNLTENQAFLNTHPNQGKEKNLCWLGEWQHVNVQSWLFAKMP